MNETSIDMALVWRLLGRRKAALLVLAVLGGCVGAALSLVLSPGYVSTSKVLLQGSRSLNEVSGETQIATSLIVLNHAADDLSWGIPGSQLQGQVSATITDGNVLNISGSAPTPTAAQQLTDKVTSEYVNFTSQIVSDAATASSDSTARARTTIQQKIDDANKRITEIQTSPAITSQSPDGEQARSDLQQQQRVVADATKQLDQLDEAAASAALNASLSGSSTRIIQLPILPTAHGSPTLLHLALGGAAAFALLGVLAHLIALRTDKRLRRAQDMAESFGAPVLGVVATRPAQADKPSLLKRLLHDDRRWAYRGVPVLDDVRGRDARYQRVLRRMLPLGRSAAEVVAVVPSGDQLALGALVGLAVAAAAGPVPVALITEDEAWAAEVTLAAEQHGVGSRLTAGPAVPDHGSALTIVVARMLATQPTVPDIGATDGLLLLVEVGTRTSWELAGIAGACVDAGQPLLGVVAVVPTDEPGTGASSGSALSALDAADTTMAGSA
jgi:capsular polysaccharide biosynthesis protein